MLTTKQKTQFAEALVDSGWFSDPEDAIDDIVETRDTMVNFIEESGKPHETMTATNGVVLLIWRRIQRARGHPRHDLLVADFGDARAAFVG
jgi:hypothetical protein